MSYICLTMSKKPKIQRTVRIDFELDSAVEALVEEVYSGVRVWAYEDLLNKGLKFNRLERECNRLSNELEETRNKPVSSHEEYADNLYQDMKKIKKVLKEKGIEI